MSSVKATCLDACTGSTNGFQPAARYQCYVEPDSATGKCPTTGYFTRQEEDWNFHAPEGVSRPTFCIADYDALKEQYGEPDRDDSLEGDAQTNEGRCLDAKMSVHAQTSVRASSVRDPSRCEARREARCGL